MGLRFSFNRKALKKRLIGWTTALGVAGLASYVLTMDLSYIDDAMDQNKEHYVAPHLITTDIPDIVEEITVSSRGFDSYTFTGFDGLEQSEADALVKEFDLRLEKSAYYASHFHYSAAPYNDIIKGYEVIDLVQKLDPEKSHTDNEIKVFVEKQTTEMLQKLDYRSKYINHETAKRWFAQDNNESYAYGFLMEDHEQGILIDYVHKGPAQKHGLEQGDIIIGVNGQSFEGLSFEEKAELIQESKENSEEAEFSVLKQSGKIMALEFAAGTVNYNPVRASIIDEKTLVLELSSFSRGSADYMREAVENAQEQYGDKLENIVIDLRNNGGGYVTAVNAMLDDFTDGDSLGYSHTRIPQNNVFYRFFNNVEGDHHREDIPSYEGQITDLPIRVLINSNSASASEVMAGNLQAVGRAQVIGKTTSYGKGTMQTYIDIGGTDRDMSQVGITMGLLFLPEDGPYQGHGIQPDILVTPDYDGQLDNLRYERDNPNILTTESNYSMREPQYSCDISINGESLTTVWAKHADVDTGYTKRVNLGADSDLLCAIDSFNKDGQQDYIKPKVTKPTV